MALFWSKNHRKIIEQKEYTMKQKQVLMGMLGFVLAFGLGMALTSCGPKTAEISVTNNSQYENDSTVSVMVYMQGRNDPMGTKAVSKGQTGTFSLDAGDYRIAVTRGDGSICRFPQDGSNISMSGSFQLSYNGSDLKRTN